MKQKIHTCGHCRTEFLHGNTACTGCLGTIVYGPTDHEVANAAKMGMLVGILLIFLTLVISPIFLNQTFEFSIPLFWGLGIGYGMLLGLVLVILCMIIARVILNKLSEGVVRTFR